jgi:hypothetical protein
MQEDIEMDSNAMAATTQVWLNYCRLECRSCRRRLYEELLKPILDHPPLPLAARCSLRREIIEERQTAAKVRLHCEIWVQYEQDYLSDIERALVKHIRTTVLPMYRVMGVCQALAESEHYKRSSNRLYVCARDFEPVYHSPRLRTHGIAVRSYPNRVMLEVIAGTRLMNLRALFSGEAPTTILLADDVRDIRAIVNEAAKLRHIRLLGVCACADVCHTLSCSVRVRRSHTVGE